mmetsp:Transcript_18061/g.37624  ORF Transcript_18061/g.37624 Transcript_18061/m.37624 type:complete len:213 (-) Transcript_18061:287-925(-)
MEGKVAREASAIFSLHIEVLTFVLYQDLGVRVQIVKLVFLSHHVLSKYGLHWALEGVVARLQCLVLRKPPLLPHVQRALADGPSTPVEGDNRRLIDGHEGDRVIMQPLVAVLCEERELARAPLHHENHDGLHAKLCASALGNLRHNETADGVAQQCEGARVHGFLEGLEAVIRELVQAAADRFLLAMPVAGELVQGHFDFGRSIQLELVPVL